MPVWFNNEIDKFKIQKKRILKKWIKDIINHYNYSVGEINYIFLNDRNLLEINKKFLKHDNFTDVISFNYTDSNYISGDIYISVERVIENSSEYHVSFDNEMKRVVIHGILHFLGFDDKTEPAKAVMRSKEEDALQSVKELLIFSV